MAEFLGAAILMAGLAIGQTAPAVPSPAAGVPAVAADTPAPAPAADTSKPTPAPAPALAADSIRPAQSADTAWLASSDPAAKPPARLRYPGAPLLLQVPLVDYPHGFDGANSALGFYSPSMRQSLLWNISFTQLGIQTLAWTWESRGWDGFLGNVTFWSTMGLASFVTTYLPPGEGWLHEEWHRAVMTRRSVESYDEIYDFEIGGAVVSVSGETDADLARLKADHPADFIRLMSAGMEGSVESHRQMRRNNFFLGRSSHHDRFFWWVGGINVTYYLAACANGWIDEDIEEMEAKEGTVSERDFTGPDFTAWVHDLRRPHEHYAAGPRGRAHPSGGPGYRRYLTSKDLTSEERDYLNLQAVLSLLNFTSPQFWGPDWMPGVLPWDGQGVLWNAGLVHHLTPFGYQVAADLLLRRGKWGWVFTAQAHASSSLVLPGLTAELVRYPVLVGRTPVFLTGAASAWLQPDGLLFDSEDVLPGGALLAGASVPFAGGLEFWAEGDAKTEGWVPGNVYLDPAVQVRAGLAWRL